MRLLRQVVYLLIVGSSAYANKLLSAFIQSAFEIQKIFCDDFMLRYSPSVHTWLKL